MDKRENIKVRKVEANVKGINIEFDEYYKINPVTGEEIFDRDLEIENDTRLYDIYKKQMNLLTSSEIKDIRKKIWYESKRICFSNWHWWNYHSSFRKWLHSNKISWLNYQKLY